MSDYYNQWTDGIMDYLSLFNQIDKHFDKVLDLERYIPFNEKIKRLIEWNYSISWFVSLHKYQLRFLWELRNHITHWLKLDGHTYSQPTPYALKKISKLAKAIKKPPTSFKIFKKKVFCVKENDLLKSVLPTMKKFAYTHVPVYSEDNTFLGIFTEGIICYWLANNMKIKSKMNMETIKIMDIPLHKNTNEYLFITKDKNIYEIDEIFTKRRMERKRLWAVFITETGKQTEKILWIITAWDVALIDTFVVH